MGAKQLKKLTREYLEAVLSGGTVSADIVARLKLEAGNGFSAIEAEVAREKAERDAQTTADAAPCETPGAEVAGGEAVSALTTDLPTRGAGLGGSGDDGAAARSAAGLAPSELAVPEVLCESHHNDIHELPESDSWEVCIDESYLGKDTPGVRAGDFYGQEGYGLIAGVVFPSSNPLPPIAQLHCAKSAKEGPKTAEELRREEEALGTILRHPACGVLALPARAQEMTLGYTDLLISWTCVMISLLRLPEGDGEVVVRCHVEPRSELQTDVDFESYRQSCIRQLRESFPALARRVRLECDRMPKVKDPSAKTLNSYADVVAHTCQHFGQVAGKRYKRTGWSGVCCLDAEPKAVAKLLHLLFRGERLEDAAWTTLLKCEESGFARAQMAHVGERARQDYAEWQGYLDETVAHLRSGAIDMRLLRLQVKWLEMYRPDAPLPKRAELLWLTARLALANHEGRRIGDLGLLRADFDAACVALYEEDVNLVCRAVLNLAVAYTNAYEFEMALAVLQSLLEKEVAFVGRENYGQLLSSAGQHFAFLGDADRAIENFKAAIKCFDGLTDSEKRVRNIGITSAYLATAVMDGKPSDAVPALAYYLLGDAQAPIDRLVAETERLAQVSAESSVDKFKHHIVLRYAVSADREDPIRRAYRACGHAGTWSASGTGHPWELIEFYRALLTPVGTPERRDRFERAYQIAVKEAGDTVMVIAAVIAGAALKEGVDQELWNDRLAEACRQVSHLPALWENGRFQALADQTSEGLDALNLAKKVLPFNFR